MPIYEFLCKDCRHEFKTLKRVEQLPQVTCPTCGTAKVSRLLSVTARTASESNGSLPEAQDCGRPGGCCMGMGGCGIN